MCIHIRPLNVVERSADFLMVPVMYIVSGTLEEEPQRTHRWNNHRLSKAEVSYLNQIQMTFSKGVKTKIQRHGGVAFHMPIIGGWTEYIVITPPQPQAGWHVGWHNSKVSGVSRIHLTEPARLLSGPDDCFHFGVNTSGYQLPVTIIGRGRIGDNGQFKNLPLL